MVNVGPYSESYAYNANGLMTTGPLGAGYSYGNAAHKHAVTAVGSNSFAYDANGNMTGRTLAGSGSSTLTYDAENRLVSVSGAASASFVYDGDNGRVKVSVNGATTTYVGSHYEVEQLLCTGQTTPGSTGWQVHTANSLYLDVNTSSCGLASTPLYLTSLGGNSGHWATSGATAIYNPTATGFTVYVRTVDGSALTPAQANSWGWHLNWVAAPKNLALSSLCSGQTTPGSTAWQTASGGIMVSVGTASCSYTYLPTYLTSLGGSADQWLTTGANAIYDPALSCFSAYVRYWDGSALTPAQANANGWHLNWLALNGNTSIVRKYYYAGNTRVAMRENGQLRWLLSDHLGSTAYTVSGASKTGEVRYRAFGATRFTSGLTPTTYRYTGQREEAGLGLYYYGARWYDPTLGRFVQADTLVPNPADAKAYDRYAYVNNNPLKYTDPSGHCGMLAELGESFTSPFGQTCLGMNAGLSRRAKAALAAGGGLTAAAALNAGLATGSPPSQADAPVPLLETVPGQALQEGAITTSVPLGGSDTLSSPIIQPLTAPAQQGLNIVAAKPGPKPWPEGSHNETIARRIDELQRQLGPDWELEAGGPLTEEVIDIPAGGNRSQRRPDITFRNRVTGEYYRENVGRTYANREPVRREVKALDDLERATGQRPGYTPYD